MSQTPKALKRDEALAAAEPVTNLIRLDNIRDRVRMTKRDNRYHDDAFCGMQPVDHQEVAAVLPSSRFTHRRID